VVALTIEFDFKGQRFKDASKGLAAFAQFQKSSMKRASPALKKQLRVYLNSAVFALLRQHSKGWPAGTTVNSLSRRSGALGRSIRSSVRVDGNTLKTIEGRIGGSRIARVHEFGAIIKVRKAQYLTIPLKAALNNRGIPKKRRARDWKNTFVRKSKRGNLIIFQKRGKGLIPLYVLKKSVKIPPRLGMGKVLESEKAVFVDRAFEAMVDAMAKGKR